MNLKLFSLNIRRFKCKEYWNRSLCANRARFHFWWTSKKYHWHITNTHSIKNSQKIGWITLCCEKTMHASRVIYSDNALMWDKWLYCIIARSAQIVLFIWMALFISPNSLTLFCAVYLVSCVDFFDKRLIYQCDGLLRQSRASCVSLSWVWEAKEFGCVCFAYLSVYTTISYSALFDWNEKLNKLNNSQWLKAAKTIRFLLEIFGIWIQSCVSGG